MFGEAIEKKRIAVGRRPRDRLGGDIGAGAAFIDDEILVEPRRQPLAEEPRDDVGRAARRKAVDPAHRTGRIIERRRRARQRRSEGGARRTREKNAA